MAVLITPLYYKYPYSLQSLQTEVKQSNLEMGGYFTLALWSNRCNTQACRAMLALPRRKSNILVTSNTVFLHFLPAAYVKELSTRPKLGFQTSNCKGTALRNNRCRLTAKSETKHGQTGLLGTGRARGQAQARHCSGKMQTTKPSSGPRGAHAYFSVYFYLMLSIATF